MKSSGRSRQFRQWVLSTLQRRRACSSGVIQNSRSGHSEMAGDATRNRSNTRRGDLKRTRHCAARFGAVNTVSARRGAASGRQGRRQRQPVSVYIHARQGREERRQLRVVDLVHSSRKRAAIAREMYLGVTEGGKGARLLITDTVSGLAEAMKNLLSTRISIRVEVPELYCCARLVVRGSVTRGRWEGCGCG
jgi:hypothetical protein